VVYGGHWQSDLLAFEKEIRNNRIIMVLGIIAAAAGVAVAFTFSRSAGILILIIGVALLVISFSISNVFFKLKMIERLEGRNKTK